MARSSISCSGSNMSSPITGSRVWDRRGKAVLARLLEGGELTFDFFTCGAACAHLLISAKEYSISSVVQIEATEKFMSSRISISVLFRRRDENRPPAMSLAHILTEKDVSSKNFNAIDRAATAKTSHPSTDPVSAHHSSLHRRTKRDDRQSKMQLPSPTVSKLTFALCKID